MISLADSVRFMPPVTRFFTICSVAMCFAKGLELIEVETVSCFPPQIIEKWVVVYMLYSFEFPFLVVLKAALISLSYSYKFFTAFIVPGGLRSSSPGQAIMDIYFFYNFAKQLEDRKGKFRGNFPDCLWFTLLTGTIIIVLTFVFYYAIGFEYSFPNHHQMMLSCVTYLWSRESKNAQVSFLGIIPIKAYYLPLFNLSLKLFESGYWSFVDTIIGILGGYLYQCIQSNTMPIYNLFPGAYSQIGANRLRGGVRVGTVQSLFKTSSSRSREIEDDLILSSIFDRGYLKAPIWLYKLLDYPIDTSERSTAFVIKKPVATVKVSTGTTNSAFKGVGMRLGD